MSVYLYLLDCFLLPELMEEHFIKLKDCIQQGELLTEEMIQHYTYLDKENEVIPRLLDFLESCYYLVQENELQQCDHIIWNDGEKGGIYCTECGITQVELQDKCKHVWYPAGHKKNKDRVHNKGNGKGKYQVYKCQECGKFKRRYIK